MEYNRYKEIEIKKAIRCKQFCKKNYIRKEKRSLDLDNISKNDETQLMLCKDYLQILQQSNDLEETNFEELIDTVKNWYMNWCKLSLNHHHNNEITSLQSALKDCQLKDVEEILSVKH